MCNKPIAIIPARGGSTRIKNKNLQSVGGTSLVMRAVNVARKSGCFSQVIVSTEDSRIEKEVCDVAVVDKRPTELANNTATVLQVVTELIDRRFLNQSDIGVLLPTCALRTIEDIRGAFDLFESSSGATVVSVCEYETPVHLSFKLNEKGHLTPIFPEAYSQSTRSIDHPKALRYNGAIIFNKAVNFFKQNTLVGENAIGFEMPPERSVDIDWLYQLEIAKSLI
jgi:CMP-N-acetylneuraminic acid synthetase